MQGTFASRRITELRPSKDCERRVEGGSEPYDGRIGPWRSGRIPRPASAAPHSLLSAHSAVADHRKAVPCEPISSCVPGARAATRRRVTDAVRVHESGGQFADHFAAATPKPASKPAEKPSHPNLGGWPVYLQNLVTITVSAPRRSSNRGRPRRRL